MALTQSRWDLPPDAIAGPWPVPAPARLRLVPPVGVRPGSRASRCAKRTLDLTLGLSLLLALLPVLLGLALLIRRDGGSALFRHRRIGRDGQPIDVWKFRSMAPDAEAILAADPELRARHRANGYKLPPDEDPRITPLGRMLRASSLDELPQLLNVVCGDMSLVGPRPIVPEELEEYRRRGGAPAYRSVRPGMTGAWQVSGRSLVGYDERVALDVAYAQRTSVRTDLGILLRTGRVVVRRVGAH